MNNNIDQEKIYNDFIEAAVNMKHKMISLALEMIDFIKVIKKMRMEYILNDPEIRADDQSEAAEVPEVRADGRAGGHEPGIL